MLAAMTEGPISRSVALTPASRQAKSGRKTYPARRSAGTCTASCIAPPTSVPIASPRSALAPNCGSNHQPRPIPTMIEPRLKKLEAIAGTPKTFRALSIPIARAAMDTRRMNGYITRVSVMVNAALSPPKPGASASTNAPDARIPIKVMALRTTMAIVHTLLASLQAAASPSVAKVLLKVVVKAVESAPSANRSRNRLGIRNAMVKASMSSPPPNNAAFS